MNEQDDPVMDEMLRLVRQQQSELKPGGPPVNEEQLEAFVCRALPDDEARKVAGLVREYLAWNQFDAAMRQDIISRVNEGEEDAVSHLPKERPKTSHIVVAVVVALAVMMSMPLLFRDGTARASGLSARIMIESHTRLPPSIVQPARPIRIDAAAIGPHQKKVAYASSNLGTISIVPVHDVGAIPATRAAHGAEVTTIAWAGKVIATGGADGRIVRHKADDPTDRKSLLDDKLAVHAVRIMRVAFSAKGDYLAAIDRLGVVSVWRTDGTFVCKKAAYSGIENGDDGEHGRDLCWHPSKLQLATVGGGSIHRIKFWSLEDTDEEQCLTHLATHDPHLIPNPSSKDKKTRQNVSSISWSPDGKHFLTIAKGGNSFVWLVEPNEKARTMLSAEPLARYRHAEVGPGGLASGHWLSNDQIVLEGRTPALEPVRQCLWKWQAGSFRGGGVRPPALARAGQLAFSVTKSDYMTSVQGESGAVRLISSEPLLFREHCTSLDVRGNAAGIGCSDGRVHYLQSADKELITLFPKLPEQRPKAILDVRLNPQTELLAAIPDENWVDVWNVTTQAHIRIDGVSGRFCEWSKDGKYLAVAEKSGQLSVWRVNETGLELFHRFTFENHVWSIDWTPDKRGLLLVGLSSTFGWRIVDLEDMSTLVVGRHEPEDGASTKDWLLRDHVRLRVLANGKSVVATSYYGNWAVFNIDEESLDEARQAARTGDGANDVERILSLRRRPSLAVLNDHLSRPIQVSDHYAAVHAVSGSVFLLPLKPQPGMSATDTTKKQPEDVAEATLLASVTQVGGNSARVVGADAFGNLSEIEIPTNQEARTNYDPAFSPVARLQIANDKTLYGFDQLGFVYVWSPSGKLVRLFRIDSGKLSESPAAKPWEGWSDSDLEWWNVDSDKGVATRRAIAGGATRD